MVAYAVNVADDIEVKELVTYKKLFMHQPEGFMIQDKEDHVFLLKKSLYGLKQFPRQWYKRFGTFMAERGYTKSAYDSYGYHQRLVDGSHIYLLIYVDDMYKKEEPFFERVF
ncbi:hypothetical protein RJ639_034903 [Escallonia herrerae]|uniref:Reverse transcriptase Ty1/copia-type domain-containing protein n=1 Tax=Escallonia herrerae TaxID=1293975 RepID=A0AA88WT83_9ASTE|nr:hypothetical protein RJ639_034903 [Escallonia herrerae]